MYYTVANDHNGAKLTFETQNRFVVKAEAPGVAWTKGKRLDDVLDWFRSKGYRVWVSGDGLNWKLFPSQ